MYGVVVGCRIGGVVDGVQWRCEAVVDVATVAVLLFSCGGGIGVGWWVMKVKLRNPTTNTTDYSNHL